MGIWEDTDKTDTFHFRSIRVLLAKYVGTVVDLLFSFSFFFF